LKTEYILIACFGEENLFMTSS